MHKKEEAIKAVIVVVIMLLSMFVVSLAFGQETQQTKPSSSAETLEQRLSRLKAEEAKLLASELPEERLVRIRAEQIRLAKEFQESLDALRKKDTKDMRQARKEIDKGLEREAKAEKARARVLQDAAITGCNPEEFPVTVASRATGNRAWTSYVKVRVINLHSRPINIEDESGVIVTGLCPGGSVTLFRARNLVLDGAYFSFQYVARGQFPDGSQGLSKSQMYTLSAYDISSGRGQQFYNWEVQLQKYLPAR